MNRINAFRLQGYESFDGICKVLHSIQERAAIDQFQQRQPLFQQILDHARHIQEYMLVEINKKSSDSSPERGSSTWINPRKETIESRQM